MTQISSTDMYRSHDTLHCKSASASAGDVRVRMCMRLRAFRQSALVRVLLKLRHALKLNPEPYTINPKPVLQSVHRPTVHAT